MSWNKNTHNVSSVSNMIKILDSVGVRYKLTEIGKVKGMGLNDKYDPIINGVDSEGYYTLHKLEYTRADGLAVVVIEQMQRTYDCDDDDCIVCNIVNNPNEYLTEIYYHHDDFGCAKNCSCKVKTLLISPNSIG